LVDQLHAWIAKMYPVTNTLGWIVVRDNYPIDSIDPERAPDDRLQVVRAAVAYQQNGQPLLAKVPRRGHPKSLLEGQPPEQMLGQECDRISLALRTICESMPVLQVDL
jgi:hypothetical protein